MLPGSKGLLPEEQFLWKIYHLRFDSVKITTLDYKEPKIRVEAWPNAAGEVKVEILEKQIVTRKAVAGESAGQTDETIEQCIDENAVQPTVQNSDKASDKIIALEILQADGKFSREIALDRKSVV